MPETEWENVDTIHYNWLGKRLYFFRFFTYFLVNIMHGYNVFELYSLPMIHSDASWIPLTPSNFICSSTPPKTESMLKEYHQMKQKHPTVGHTSKENWLTPPKCHQMSIFSQLGEESSEPLSSLHATVLTALIWSRLWSNNHSWLKKDTKRNPTLVQN